MTTTTLDRPPRLHHRLRGRLAEAHRRGWLVTFHLSSCERLRGWPARIDRAAGVLAVQMDPDGIRGERELRFDEVCEAECVSLVLLAGCRPCARLAEVAPWRAPGQGMLCDPIDGAVAAGWSGEAMAAQGRRRIRLETAEGGHLRVL